MRCPILTILVLSFAFSAACGPSEKEKQEKAKAEERVRLESALQAAQERDRMPVLTQEDVLQQGERGLQYLDLTPGTGKSPVAGDTVKLQFIGWCDGTKIDSSFDRGREMTYLFGEPVVIEGWNVGIAGMKEGGTRLLVIPPELAYGSQGRTGFVGPDKTLWYKIELVKVIH